MTRELGDLAAVAHRFPGRETWHGVSGIRYGRLLKSSPPVIGQADDGIGLAEAIGRAVIALQDGRRP